MKAIYIYVLFWNIYLISLKWTSDEYILALYITMRKRNVYTTNEGN